MLSQSDLRSAAFDRLTGRERPSLDHPTSEKFDPSKWQAFLEEKEPSRRDLELAAVALFLYGHVSALRAQVIGSGKAGLSSTELIRLGVAATNRAYLITRKRGHQALERHLSERDVVDAKAAVRTGGSPLQPNMTADEVITTLGDTIPHWLHAASTALDSDLSRKLPWDEAAVRLEAGLSIERGIRNLWQTCLWEGSRPRKIGDKIAIDFDADEDAKLWAAWEFRQESLYYQEAMLQAAEVRSGVRPKTGPGYLTKGPLRLYRGGSVLRAKYGLPSARLRRRQHFLIDGAESSYLENFLDGGLQGASTITPRQLLLALSVVGELTELAIDSLPRTAIITRRDVNALSIPLPRSLFIQAIRECLEISDGVATSLFEAMCTNAADISGAFRRGIWHRPLITQDGSDHCLVVAGPVLAGSPIRQVEQWLVDFNGADLTSTSRGVRYEAEIRRGLAEAVHSNDLFTDVAATTHAIKRVGGGEEIDAVVRVGRTIFVCEIKCLLVPSESLERANHIGKIEAAARQASIKAAWLTRNPDILTAVIGDIPDSPRYLPLVILNHGIGLGLKIGGTYVTDAHYMKLLLGSPEYMASTFIGPSGDFVPEWVNLYRSEHEFQQFVEHLLEHPPGLKKYLPAVEIRYDEFPTSTGTILVPACELNQERLFSPAALARAHQLFGVKRRSI